MFTTVFPSFRKSKKWKRERKGDGGSCQPEKREEFVRLERLRHSHLAGESQSRWPYTFEPPHSRLCILGEGGPMVHLANTIDSRLLGDYCKTTIFRSRQFFVNFAARAESSA